jgi:hypothetical protein
MILKKNGKKEKQVKKFEAAAGDCGSGRFYTDPKL